MAGISRQRVAEIICQTSGMSKRGSGYELSPGVVLTAAHVVAEPLAIVVRFNADQPDERSRAAMLAVADRAADVAVLTYETAGAQASGCPAEGMAAARFGVVARLDVVVPFSAVGFPRFKLRQNTGSAEDRRLPEGWCRDSYHAHGTIAPLSNLRQARLELELMPPGHEPDPRHSPWEGMSGAPVWVDNRIVGLISEHHAGDGPHRLTATSVDRWYRMSSDRLDRLRELTGLPQNASKLTDVSKSRTRPSGPLARSGHKPDHVVYKDSVIFNDVTIAADTVVGRDNRARGDQP